jgi:hypothetical protein
LVDARFNADNLSKEIEQRTKRVSELVKAIKIYSYLDQFPLQEVDVHEELESTLTILGHEIRVGVESGKRGGVAYREILFIIILRECRSGSIQNILFVPWRICKKIERRMN